VKFGSPLMNWCEGMQVQLTPDIQYAQSLQWQSGATTPSITVRQPGLYSITATNYCGSRFAAVELVRGVCKLYVPTAFSPNGDGVNDIFLPGFGEGISQYEMQVYNRWGQKVFTSTDRNKGWDGRFNGRMVPGVYTWVIAYREAAAPGVVQRMKGTVLVVR
jgi:gliding motility-associated-like protein